MSTSSPVEPFSRRGTCPALSAPMQTGDGLLSRVAFTTCVSSGDFEKLCNLAPRHGNGLVDITARGGVQFRGLTAESAVALERDVLALNLPLRQGVAVETSPIAGVDGHERADPTVIISRIHDRATELGLHWKLAAKMSVIVDGDGLVGMGGLLADIRLKAVESARGIVWQLGVGGTEDKALVAGFLWEDEAADCVIHLLSCLAERGPDARGRDLDIGVVHRICGARLMDAGAFGLSPSAQVHVFAKTGKRTLPHPVCSASPDGENAASPSSLSEGMSAAKQRGGNHTRQRRLWQLSDGLCVAIIAPAFGQISAKALSALCRKATELGIVSVRPGPMHALYFLGQEDVCAALLFYADEAGFIVSDGDPRAAIAVCSGSPACASAFAPVQNLAAIAVTECEKMLDGSFTLHLSGCGKGCAHPSPALLAFSGTPEGIAFGYSAKATGIPELVLAGEEQKAAFSRLAGLYEKEHKPGENARAVFTRLGKARVTEALRQDER